MMKKIILFLFIICCNFSVAQSILRPGSDFERQWLVNRVWKMNMRMVSSSTTRDIGVIQYSWINDGDNFDFLTEVVIPGLPPKSWLDSLTVDAKTLAPVRHKSVNMQRDILIDYGKVIGGYYLDKQKNVNTPFTYDVEAPVFDSGFYLFLLQLLPLESFSTPAEIGIFDFKPKGKQGVLKAFITSVESGIYESPMGDEVQAWIVKSYDNIGRGEQTTTYISKSNRDLLKQETLDKEGNGMVLEMIWDGK